jgi:hypothetical protein
MKRTWMLVSAFAALLGLALAGEAQQNCACGGPACQCAMPGACGGFPCGGGQSCACGGTACQCITMGACGGIPCDGGGGCACGGPACQCATPGACGGTPCGGGGGGGGDCTCSYGDCTCTAGPPCCDCADHCGCGSCDPNILCDGTIGSCEGVGCGFTPCSCPGTRCAAVPMAMCRGNSGGDATKCWCDGTNCVLPPDCSSCTCGCQAGCTCAPCDCVVLYGVCFCGQGGGNCGCPGTKNCPDVCAADPPCGGRLVCKDDGCHEPDCTCGPYYCKSYNYQAHHDKPFPCACWDCNFNNCPCPSEADCGDAEHCKCRQCNFAWCVCQTVGESGDTEHCKCSGCSFVTCPCEYMNQCNSGTCQ